VDFTFKEEPGAGTGCLEECAEHQECHEADRLDRPTRREAVFAEAYAYASQSKSYAMMKPAVAAGLSTSPDNLKQEFKVDGKWWTDNLDAINRRWLEWRTAH